MSVMRHAEKKDRERTAALTATNKQTHSNVLQHALIIVKTVIIHVEQVK